MLSIMSDPQQVPPYAPPNLATPPPAAYPGAQQPSGQQPNPTSAASQYPGPGYVLNGQPTTTPPTGNAAGRIGLILGIVALAIGVVMRVVFQVMVRTEMLSTIGIASGIGTVITFLIGIAALICGLVGLSRRDAPHGTAGIATGIGLAVVVIGISNFLIMSLGNLFMSF